MVKQDMTGPWNQGGSWELVDNPAFNPAQLKVDGEICVLDEQERTKAGEPGSRINERPFASWAAPL